MTSTSPPFGNGRDQHGRFTKGNPGGPGNPLAAKVSRLRSALIEAVTEDDIRQIAEMLVGLARGGDMAATKELLLRTLGRPVEPDLIERLERVEELLQGQDRS
jgi:hypothetical protein